MIVPRRRFKRYRHALERSHEASFVHAEARAALRALPWWRLLARSAARRAASDAAVRSEVARADASRAALEAFGL